MARIKGRRDAGLELFDNSSENEEPSPSKDSKKRKAPAKTIKGKIGKGKVPKKGKVADVRSPKKTGKRKRDEEASDPESDEEVAPQDPESET